VNCEVRSIIQAGQGGWTASAAELLVALLVPVANSSGTAETFAPSESSDLLSTAVAVWVLIRFLSEYWDARSCELSTLPLLLLAPFSPFYLRSISEYISLSINWMQCIWIVYKLSARCSSALDLFLVDEYVWPLQSDHRPRTTFIWGDLLAFSVFRMKSSHFLNTTLCVYTNRSIPLTTKNFVFISAEQLLGFQSKYNIF